jgi:hypothetical protein
MHALVHLKCVVILPLKRCLLLSMLLLCMLLLCMLQVCPCMGVLLHAQLLLQLQRCWVSLFAYRL